jgi:hypothetical protein
MNVPKLRRHHRGQNLANTPDRLQLLESRFRSYLGQQDLFDPGNLGIQGIDDSQPAGDIEIHRPRLPQGFHVHLAQPGAAGPVSLDPRQQHLQKHDLAGALLRQVHAPSPQNRAKPAAPQDKSAPPAKSSAATSRPANVHRFAECEREVGNRQERARKITYKS